MYVYGSEHTDHTVETRVIPIFPLELVLFPRQELPLTVFEPRYKQMVEDCMMGDRLFGVCMASRDSIEGWRAPVRVGTLTKIVSCRDEGLDGMRLNIETVGRGRFRILDLVPPCVRMPPDYDPSSLEGHRQFAELHQKAGNGKTYIRASVEIMPEVDQNVSGAQWQKLVDAWKRKTARRASRSVDSQSLDLLLEQYYLVTDTPTPDYVYSLAALGADSPADLQRILEADTAADLVERVESLMEAD